MHCDFVVQAALRPHPTGISAANCVVALVAALLASACRDMTDPIVIVGRVELSTTSVSFDAIGATEVVTATVRDPNGRVMATVPIQWSSTSPAVEVTPTDPLSATVRAVANGLATVVAIAGGTRTSASVRVTQRPAILDKVAGDRQTGVVGTPLADELRVRVRDRLGAPVAGQQVEFGVTGGGSIGSDKITSASDGSAATTWTLGTDASAEQLVGVAVAGVGSSAVFTATATAAAAARVTVAAGDGQSAIVGTAVAMAPSVRVTDAFGNPVAGVPVDFTTPSGTGTIAGASQTTDAQGIATIGGWTLGTGAGAKTLVATAGELTPVTFSAVARAGAPTIIMVVGGNGQQGVRGLALPLRPAVGVSDQFGNPVPAVEVGFEVVAGGGSVDGAAPTTNSAGMATLGVWTLGIALGVNSLTARISGSALPGVTFTAEALDPGTVVFNAGQGQATTAGATLATPPSVLVRNAAGTPIPGRTVTFAVTGGGGEVTGAVATTDGAGVARVGSWTLGQVAGPNALTATVAGPGLIDTTVVVSAVGCGGGGGEGYAITLCVTTAMTESQRQAFEDAAARWSAVITGDIADVPVGNIACGGSAPRLTATVDDVAIFARIEPIDGPGGILGSAGWCFRRAGGPGAGFPVIGTMRFDAADVVGLENTGRFVAVILHEMGHVLGIGTLWSSFGFLQNPSVVGGPQLDTHFNGENAITGFDEIGGLTYSGGMKVPVENRFGGGTINAHWRESVLANELMTGFVNSGNNPLSALTVQSMHDLGYQIDHGAAEPFFLTLETRAAAASDPASVQLIDDVYIGPAFTIDRQGRVVRIR